MHQQRVIRVAVLGMVAMSMCSLAMAKTIGFGVYWAGITIAKAADGKKKIVSTFSTHGFLPQTSFNRRLESLSSGTKTFRNCFGSGTDIQPCTYEEHARNDVSGTASLGSLTASSVASASSHISPGILEDTLTVREAYADGGVTAAWFDTITVTGPPPGTPVQFLVSFSLADTVLASPTDCSPRDPFPPAFASVSTNVAFGSNSMDVQSFNCRPYSGTLTAPWNVEAGGVYEIGGELTARTSVDVVGYVRHAEALANVGGGLVRKAATVGDTRGSSFYLDPITSGVSYTSEGGMDYSSSTAPEPSSLTLLSIGMLLAFWKGRRSWGRIPRSR